MASTGDREAEEFVRRQAARQQAERQAAQLPQADFPGNAAAGSSPDALERELDR